MKQIIALNGSPRIQGCTAKLVDVILEAAQEEGATVKSYYLNGLNIKGCQSCYACKPDGRCVMQDDMQQLYDEIATADGIIFATPVYMWQMSAQLKMVVDRLYPFLRRDYTSFLSPGKKVLLAVTQGRPDTSLFRRYFEHIAKNLQFLGFGACEILIAGGTRKVEDVEKQADVLAEGRRLGAWLAE